VGIGLEPRWLCHARGLGRLDHRRDLLWTALAIAKRVETAIGRDTARHVATPVLRSGQAPATPPAGSPAIGPQRPARSRASGSSAAAALAGTGRPAPGRRSR